MGPVNQETAVNYLKKKGTGQTMGKHLEPEELAQCNRLFQSNEIHLTTKATLLTAILMLENTPDENAWLDQAVANKEQVFPTDLHPLLSTDHHNEQNSTPLLNIAFHPLQHQNCNETQMQTALPLLLEPSTPEWHKAVFLEALRLKRETPTENLSTLDFYTTNSYSWETKLDHVLYLSNPFDGMKRHLPLSVFTAVLLAAVGIPTYLHGIERVGPKYGISPYQLLEAAGKNPLITPDEGRRRLENPECGWTYIDQSHSFPKAFALQSLRKHMVKRPLLATIEKLNPIFTAKTNRIVTGYTHPPYKEKSIRLCSHQNLYQHFAIVRGIEGSSEISHEKRTRIITGSSETQTTESFIEATLEAQMAEKTDQTLDITIENTLSFGLDCLSGKLPIQQNPVAHQAFHIIEQLNLLPQAQITQRLQQAITSQKALAHWEQN